MSRSSPPGPDTTGRITFREVSPRTPNGYPARAVEGDEVVVSATLVRDGHGLLAGRVRWRRTGPGKAESGRAESGNGRGKARGWSTAPLRDRQDGSGRWDATIVVGEPGRYEFEVQAWLDSFATWRRDLRERAAAGQDLTLEFEVGARLIEALVPEVPKSSRPRLPPGSVRLGQLAVAPAHANISPWSRPNGLSKLWSGPHAIPSLETLKFCTRSN